MRIAGTAAELKKRRLRALELVDAGDSFRAAARTVGCHASSVKRWFDARQAGGEAPLNGRIPTGRPRKLSPGDRSRLVRQLKRGALKHGYPSRDWTTSRVAQLITKLIGVPFSRSHAWRLMRELRWVYVAPMPRVWASDEEEVKRWKSRNWPVGPNGGWKPS